MELDDEDYEMLGWATADRPVSGEAAQEVLRTSSIMQSVRWTRETIISRDEVGPRRHIEREIPLRRHGPRRASASKQKTAAWRAATKRYAQSAKGKTVRSKTNRKQYEKRKADPVKYAAWLAANRARYAAKKGMKR